MMEDIFDEMRAMQEEMDRLFGRVFRTRPMLEQSRDIKTADHFRSPIADIKETDNSVIARFELPGADKKDIELNVTDDYIEVKSEKRSEKKQEKMGYHSYESMSKQFYRRVPLPSNVVKADAAKANYKDGVLKIEIPKQKAIEKKKIKIE
ncbi:MAG: Hsp20/alpha crystallin family protein [Candidatus Nanoarchaeia archaeon]|nr:Hsp20/alpha crystallin family protein [Candidatus Nanoarchaeia archaeon]